MLGILVVFGPPGQHAWRAQGELIEQFLFLEGLGADDLDGLDLGDVAFGDVEIHRYPVALQRGRGRLDLDRVDAAVVVLALEFLLCLVQQGTVEDAAIGQPQLLKTGLDVILGKFLQPGKIHTGDGGAFFHADHEHTALGLESDILEESGGIERLDRGGCHVWGKRLADFHRQVAEHGTRLGTLDAFDTDVLDLKGFESLCLSGEQGKEDQAVAERVHYFFLYRRNQNSRLKSL